MNLLVGALAAYPVGDVLGKVYLAASTFDLGLTDGHLVDHLVVVLRDCGVPRAQQAA